VRSKADRYGVLDRLHELPAPAPIVTLSDGEAGEASKEAGTGAIDRIRKPVGPAEVVSTVDRVLSLSAHERLMRGEMLRRAAGWYDELTRLRSCVAEEDLVVTERGGWSRARRMIDLRG
jgi:FixJ family two-component response regulator